MLKKAVAYCRVSSKEQEKEGFSIPAQQKLLREYADRNGIDIIREFADAETAKSTGREQFGEMIEFLRRAQARIILVEKTDRLYRNFRDYVTLDDFDVEIHLVKEGEVLSKDSASHQKFIHGIKVLMAKNYIDNLSEEVKKGLYEKAANGQYPGQAPTGYLNDRDRRIMVIDPERAPLVRKMFELYATRDYTLDMLFDWAKSNGLWSKYGKPLSRGNIERILKNPVYYGGFVYGGKLYKGIHEPIVTKQLWDDVQAAFGRHNKIMTKRKDDFAFAGLLTCAGCGCAVVAELKKGRYVYYHCSGSKRDCSIGKEYVREEVLAEQFSDIMASIRVDDETIGRIVGALKASATEKNKFRDEAIAGLRQKSDTLRARIDKAFVDKLDGRITEAFWLSHANRWQEELAAIECEIAAYSKADVPYYEWGKWILELGQNAHRLYLRGTNDDKRYLLNLVKSNFSLRGATIEYKLRSPFNQMAEWALKSRSAPPIGRPPNLF
jgi:DNA invertase Pin-like site-specific DNA recombinase